MCRLDDLTERVSRQIGATSAAVELGDALSARSEHLRCIPQQQRPGDDQLGGERDEALRNVRALIAKPLGDVTLVTIGRRVDGDAAEVAERPLRQDGEGGQPFNLIAEQLDPHGLPSGRREDVDDVATDRHLATLVDGTVDAVVADGGQAPHEDVAVDRFAVRDGQTDRTRRTAVEALNQRLGGDRNDAAGCQRRQRLCTLAREVRSGLEARAPVDAAVGQVRNRRRRGEGRDGIGELPGAVVVRNDDRERGALLALALKVQRGDHERKHSLRAARRHGSSRAEPSRDLSHAIRRRKGCDDGVEAGNVGGWRRGSSLFVHGQRRASPPP